MQKTKSRRWIWIVLGVLVFLCIAAALVFYLFAPRLQSGGPTYTSAMQIAISRSKITSTAGTDVFFIVPAKTNLTLQVNDTNPHQCKIERPGEAVVISVNGGKASGAFQLKGGDYRLWCDNNPNRSVSVSTQ